MILVARERLARTAPYHRVALEQGDAAHLPFCGESFDAIFISFALGLFDIFEITAVLSECHRVLKRDGQIVVVAMARDEQENLPQRIYEWFHHYFPAYVDCRPIFVQSSLTLSGFQIKDVTRKMMWGLPVDICLALKPRKGDDD